MADKKASYLDGYIAGLEVLMDYDRDRNEYLNGLADAVREYAEGDILDLREHLENMKLERDHYGALIELGAYIEEEE